MNNKLIFVYNADSSLFAQVTDFAHKIFKPETYACNLCKLTYGSVSMKQEWKKFIQSLAYTVEFLHRDEFAKAYPDKAATPLPAVFRQTQSLELLVSSDEINRAKSLFDLKNLIINKLYKRSIGE